MRAHGGIGCLMGPVPIGGEGIRAESRMRLPDWRGEDLDGLGGSAKECFVPENVFSLRGVALVLPALTAGCAIWPASTSC
jgi:hypothetical protein